MSLSSKTEVGLAPVEDAIVIKASKLGVDLEHVSTHTRSSRSSSSETKSSVMRYRRGGKCVSVSIVVITVSEGTYASAAIYDASSNTKLNSSPLYSKGFTVGESLSLHEVVEAVTLKIANFLRA